MGKRRSSFVASDNSGDERPTKVSKKANKKASTTSGEADVDADGNPFWELSNKRRVVVSKFSGKMFVNVREYYEDKSGEMKPGKKGIMLSVEQYQALASLIPTINAELRKKGVVLDGDDKEEEKDQDDEEEEEEETKARSSKSAAKTKKKQSKKANIDATSDEDED